MKNQQLPSIVFSCALILMLIGAQQLQTRAEANNWDICVTERFEFYIGEWKGCNKQ